MRAFFFLILAGLGAPPLVAQTVVFEDISKTAGITFRHVSGSPLKNYTLETVGGGVAWFDYDRDGWVDLYFVNAGRWEDLPQGRRTVSNALYRNNADGTFTDVTGKAGLAGKAWGMGATAADFDGDGWLDLYLCNYGPNELYRNRGDGTFEEVGKKAGVDHPAWSSSAAFGDGDGDGDLDLYVTNYVVFDFANAPPPKCQYRGMVIHCGPQGMIGAPDVYYRNKGDGTFEDATRESGMEALPSYGLGVTWIDYDGDGKRDVFVANDSMANFLFHNLGGGRFEEVALVAGVAVNEDGNAQAGMGVTWGDFDRDGWLDLYMTHFSDDYNTLYRNQGDGLFQDVTYAAKLAFPTWQRLAWGTFFFDFDNDGWEDLFVANGHIYPQVDDYQIGTSFRQQLQLFRNLHTGQFEDVSGVSGAPFQQMRSSRGAAFADFDNDGDIDIAVNNMDDGPYLLRNRNREGAGHWISLELEGPAPNTFAIGAVLTLESSSGRQIGQIEAGSSFQATNEVGKHFGLGDDDSVKSLKILWPDGHQSVLENLAADRHYRVKRDGSIEAFEPGRAWR